MKKIPIEAVQLVEQELPEMVDAIQSRSKGPIVLLMDDFENQERLLYSAVWYAASHDRTVLIESEH